MDAPLPTQLNGLAHDVQQHTLHVEHDILQLQQHFAAAVAARVFAVPVSYERRSIRSSVRLANI